MILALLLLVSPAQALSETPVSLEQLYGQALEDVNRGDWPGAMLNLRAILEEDPAHIPSRFYLAVSLNATGEVEGAIDEYRAIIEQDATVFEAHMNLGALLVEDGRPEEAVEAFAFAMRLDPGDPTPAFYRAQVLDQMDRTEPAIEGYLTALDRAGEGSEILPQIYYRIGTLYRHAGRPSDDVREMLEKAVEAGSDAPEVFLALGDLEAGGGNLTVAADRYRHALSLDRDQDTAWRLALVLRDLGRLDEAIPILEGLENPEAQAVLADIFVSLERDEDAILLYDALRAVDPDNSDHWFGLGRSYYRSNKFDEAIPMMEEALQRDPGRVEAWGTLASIYYQRDDWVNAGVMLLNYLMFRPDHAASIFLLATCFDKLGDYERALLHYNQFIELDDGSDDARTFQVQQRARSLERLLEER